ncbi:homeobox-leucine zipper protein HOX11-like [Pyrus ussuriensis x Pyrus communis]|uniref:Homeobox-leucine zipper protein HOX11-like n=1 Tax=Pyrus ussuriensis x Pyrus communis TaxID=2448454 RepID=A0A5N5HXD8_9ROSA|nr:homeobox-leucine zipper protein HOX11-like [Pyrus ussuriensis x Pyrus communis]
MELALSLGDASKPFLFLDKAPKMGGNMDIGFCMGLGTAAFSAARSDESSRKSTYEVYDQEERRSRISSDPPLQLNLLPSAPVPRSHVSSQLRFPWLTDNLAVSEPAGSSDGPGIGLDVNRMPGVLASAEEAEDAAAPLSSPNSTVSSFQMDFGMRNGGRSSKRDLDVDADRASDDEENGSTRKKLRLSKDQSAFLEESFKEHSTLNPKQKLALAKQLNLRPRQVEVWFQNRRARTKLKQTEVDCEYLKRCCETLTEENRRLQKELQDLRALKTSQPFYMQLPATTLTMCPSCERVVTTASANTSTTTTTNHHHHIKSALNNNKPRLNPFTAAQVHIQQHQGAAA